MCSCWDTLRIMVKNRDIHDVHFLAFIHGLSNILLNEDTKR